MILATILAQVLSGTHANYKLGLLQPPPPSFPQIPEHLGNVVV